MKLVEKAKEFENLFSTQNKKTIGFIPTMGALHAGHLTLIKKSVKENDITIASIFVNPTQFNNLEDLDKYPRTLQRDLNLLSPLGVDYVFVPTESEIYPTKDTRVFGFGDLENVMEGRFRPGHFNGVAQVVSRLFDIVKPTNAYFGEKDFQQLAIIRKLASMLNYDININSVPIVRAESGLALSSRNERLSETQLQKAPIIYETLKKALEKLEKGESIESITNYVINVINETPEMEVEYFEIVDGNTLQKIKSSDDSDYIVGCIAVYNGEIRLIDNITLKNKS